MRAILLTCVFSLLGTVRAQVVISPGAGPYSSVYGGGGRAAGVVVPGVNVAAGGMGGFVNGAPGFQAGGGRGIYGVTRRTFMGDANVIAARYFASGGVQIPVQPANGFSGQQGYVSAGNIRMQQGYASRLATRTAPHPAVAAEKPDQNFVAVGRMNLNGAPLNIQGPVNGFAANGTTAATSFQSTSVATNGFCRPFITHRSVPANR